MSETSFGTYGHIFKVAPDILYSCFEFETVAIKF